LYFLHSQLKFGIEQIIAAGASSLAGVYQSLTQRTDAWQSFIGLVNTHYPPGRNYNPAGDDIFPVPEITEFRQPIQITCGYDEFSQIYINRSAMAEVVILLRSDNPAVLSVPATVTVPVGATSATVTFHAAAIDGPFAVKSVDVYATYAGKTLTTVAQVVPPHLAGLILTPDTVTSGDTSVATVSLNRPSLAGPVEVALFCPFPDYAVVPPTVLIPQNHPSANFNVTTPAIQHAIPPAFAVVYASYSGSSTSAMLNIRSRVVAGMLQSLNVFPKEIAGGGRGEGIVNLVEPVPIATEVLLAALEFSPDPPHLPAPSPVARVPRSIMIPAQETTGAFAIETEHMRGRSHLVTIHASTGVTEKWSGLTVTG
jgi:hypothetical protein